MKLLYKYAIILNLIVVLWSCGREKIAEPADDSIPPATPSELKVFAAFDGQVAIEWRKNNESNLKGYFIYKSINKPEHFEQISFTEMNYFVENSLFYDSTYYYKVSAVNRNNIESPLSISVSALPKNIYAPLPPTNLKANARNWTNSFGIYLLWDPPADTDILGYKIYRNTSSGFGVDSLNYFDFTQGISYLDTTRLKLLVNYYYRIIAVDKGGLKSIATKDVKDIILNSPALIYPENNSQTNSIREFRIRAVSKPAKYKLVILSNEIYGTIFEFNFSSEIVNEVIKIGVAGLQLAPFKKYFWRVYTYTNSDVDPNSYSSLYSFTFYPSN